MTGVQTCALPISVGRIVAGRFARAVLIRPDKTGVEASDDLSFAAEKLFPEMVHADAEVRFQDIVGGKSDPFGPPSGSQPPGTLYLLDFAGYGKIIWLVLLISFGTDVFAYFTGFFIKKKKLYEDISPKKRHNNIIFIDKNFYL